MKNWALRENMNVDNTQLVMIIMIKDDSKCFKYVRGGGNA